MGFTGAHRYFAEFLGTFALLLFGGGAAVISAAFVTFDPLSRVLLVSFAFGLVVAALAYAFGDVSGGHFNPAVTVSMALSRRMPLGDVLPYLLAQVAGGIVGLAVVFGIVLGGADPIPSVAQSIALGSQGYSGSGAPDGFLFSAGAVFLLEVALTFFFVLVIQMSTRAESSARNLAPMAIGVALLVANLVAIPVDGASINPARSFAPAVLAQYWSSDRWALAEVWMFWVAPIIGGILASFAERMLRPSPSA